MQKKLLVIGAGIGQVHIVQLAKSMEVYTIVVSPNGNYPAIDIADEWYDCDIYDRDRIVAYARQREIDAVVSDQNDLMMPTVAYVAERLGLPGNSFDQVMTYCDKSRFRMMCESIGVPIPMYVSVEDDTLPVFTAPLPWIIKPIDSQSNIGITKINNIDGYTAAVHNALSKSKLKKAIVEQFFVGKEYVCEGFVFEGKYYHLCFGERRYFDGQLIPSQTIFPAELDKEIQQKIISCESKITSYNKPCFGIIHSEYLVNHETGEFYIIESAIRGGGVYISSHLIPAATGIDVNLLLLQCVLGYASKSMIEEAFVNRKEKAAAYVCFTLPVGVVSKITGVEKVSNMDGVIMCDVHNLSIGEKTEMMSAKGMRKGPILIEANNRMELEKIINNVKRSVDVSVIQPDDTIASIIW